MALRQMQCFHKLATLLFKDSKHLVHSQHAEGQCFASQSPGLGPDTSVTPGPSDRCHQSGALPFDVFVSETDTSDEWGFPSVPPYDKQEDLTFVTYDLMDR